MTQQELENLIAKAEQKQWLELNLGGDDRTFWLGDWWTCLPDSIGRLTNLQKLYLPGNQLTSLPESLGKLKNLTSLSLAYNQLKIIPEWICQLTKLQDLYLEGNKLTRLPDSIGQLINLRTLFLNSNQITSLPDSLERLVNLTTIGINNNPLDDLTVLQFLPKLKRIWFLDVQLPRRYWTQLRDWQAQRLLEGENAEIRKLLIQQIGYERICQELNTKAIDYWREYSLIKIESIDIEPIVLLKMICPSTGHIHVLRVPPNMTSAQTAIMWVNHGIHPDEFAKQT